MHYKENVLCYDVSVKKKNYIAFAFLLFHRYEWSVGLADSDQPVGIFNGHERIWHDAGQLLCWTFTLPNGTFFIHYNC